MNPVISSAEDLLAYYQNSLKSARLRSIGLEMIVMIFFGLLAYISQKPVLYFVGLPSVGLIALFHRNYYGKTYRRITLFTVAFPAEWQTLLSGHSLFYRNLNAEKKLLFEKRLQIFLAEKKIEGIDTVSIHVPLPIMPNFWR